MPLGRKYFDGFWVIKEQVEGIFCWFCLRVRYGYIRRLDNEEEVWVHSRGLEMKIEESIQSHHKKRVIFDVVDAPKGNMAVKVKSCGSDCSVKSDQKLKHQKTLGDSPTEPSEVNCGPEVHGWRSPQANLEGKSQGSNGLDSVLTEEEPQREINKGALSGEDEGVESAERMERVKEKKEEVLTQSGDLQNQ